MIERSPSAQLISIEYPYAESFKWRICYLPDLVLRALPMLFDLKIGATGDSFDGLS